MLATPLPRTDLPTVLAERIGRSIVEGELEPGQTLPPQDQLSADFSVSRSVVREAVKVLAAKGMIELRPKSGTRVLERSRWQLLDPSILRWHATAANVDRRFLADLMELRLIVEPAASRLAAERATADDRQRLERALAALEAVSDDDDVDRYTAADVVFHGTLIGASHNQLLAQFAKPIENVLRTSAAITSRLPGSGAAALPLHRAVADAVARRDGPGAEAAMSELLAQTRHDVERALEARDA